MPFNKPLKELKVAVLIPCYKRHEYTSRCLDAISCAQVYDDCVFFKPATNSLRKTIIEFFEKVKKEEFDFICKVDNDCLVPKNWLNDILNIFETTNVDILSPNVMPSDAAYKHGRDQEFEKGYRPAEVIGGLWCMRVDMIRDMIFYDYQTEGLIGAVSILKQIKSEKKPRIGWTTKVCYEDMGHWSGQHEDHIKSKEHEKYSNEVGRDIAWSS